MAEVSDLKIKLVGMEKEQSEYEEKQNKAEVSLAWLPFEFMTLRTDLHAPSSKLIFKIWPRGSSFQPWHGAWEGNAVHFLHPLPTISKLLSTQHRSQARFCKLYCSGNFAFWSVFAKAGEVNCHLSLLNNPVIPDAENYPPSMEAGVSDESLLWVTLFQWGDIHIIAPYR